MTLPGTPTVGSSLLFIVPPKPLLRASRLASVKFTPSFVSVSVIFAALVASAVSSQNSLMYGDFTPSRPTALATAM